LTPFNSASSVPTLNKIGLGAVGVWIGSRFGLARSTHPSRMRRSSDRRTSQSTHHHNRAQQSVFGFARAWKTLYPDANSDGCFVLLRWAELVRATVAAMRWMGDNLILRTQRLPRDAYSVQCVGSRSRSYLAMREIRMSFRSATDLPSSAGSGVCSSCSDS
jgi:hypothetical protein